MPLTVFVVLVLIALCAAVYNAVTGRGPLALSVILICIALLLGHVVRG